MKNLHVKMENSVDNALKGIKTKRILKGMDLFHLSQEYVIISKEDYAELVDELKALKSVQ